MANFYHKVPDFFSGDKLFSISHLKEKDPDLFQQYIEKYQDHPDRKKLPYKKIPILNCRWMDVVFFSPILIHLGKVGAFFNGIPHLLIKDFISIEFAEVISITI